MRHRARRLLVSSLLLLPCAAAAPADGASRLRGKGPRVKIVKAPATQTIATKAVFRFKRTRATRTWCRRDKRPYRRCRTSHLVKYAGLRPGRHIFRVLARRGGRKVRAHRRWTVVRTLGAPAPAPAPSPAGGTPLVGATLGPPLPPPVGNPVFAEEFNGTSLDTTRWSVWNGAGNHGIGLRRPSAFSLSGGNLVVTAQTVNGQIVTGGMSHKANYVYGRYEFRVKTGPDPAATMSGIVMTWPKTQWSPEFTENDMYETGVVRNSFDTYIHYGRSYTTQKEFRHRVDATQWHTVVMDWRADSLKIYRDGRLVWNVTDRAAIPDVQHHLGIQLDPFFARTLTTPVRMYVDYVRIYK